MIKNSNSVKKIISNFVKERWWIFLALFFTLALSGVMETYPVRLMQRAVDEIVAQGKFQTVLMLIATWYGFRLIGSGAGLISNWLSGMIGADLGKKFRDVLFKRLNLANFLQLERASSSETVSRTLNDVHDLGNLITQPIVLVGKDLFIFLWAFYFLLKLDWVLLAACLPIGLLMLLVGQWISGLNRQVWRKQKTFHTRIAHSLLETISACREINIFKLWPRQKKVFDKDNIGVTKTQRSTAFLTGGLRNLTEIIWPLATVIALLFGGYRVLNGNLTTGGMIAFMWYIQRIIHPISRITNYQAQLQKSVVAMERIQEMLDWFPPVERNEGWVEMTNQIRLENISFSYDDKAIIKDIDFTISKGEIVALVGETGCGKSTLLKVILGLLTPETGQIFVDNQRIKSNHLCASPSLAAVFQDPFLFNISIKENIQLTVRNDLHDKESFIQRVMTDAYVTPFLGELSNGEDTVVGERASQLSSGQRQRVALARALAYQPALMILDEATSAVDTGIEERIYQSIFNRQSQMASIIVSHRLASILEADRIYMMKDGRILACGNHQELLKKCDEYKALYRAQLLDTDTGDLKGIRKGMKT